MPTGSAPTGGGAQCGPEAVCHPGQECVSYYGIGGTAGPKFHSCEIRCGKDGSCPDGMSCAVIADGPGEVCRR